MIKARLMTLRPTSVLLADYRVSPTTPVKIVGADSHRRTPRFPLSSPLIMASRFHSEYGFLF